MANEFEEILTWHPQLVLVSRTPVTWRGFLKINDNAYVELKMKVPNFPQTYDLSIKFGRQMSFMYCANFATRMDALLQNATSVLSFLNQMQHTMDNILEAKPPNNDACVYLFNTNRLDELRNTLDIPGITVLVDRETGVIKLTYKGISLNVTQDPINNNSWIITSSDLPQLKHWVPLEKCVSTLSEAAHTLKTRVTALENTWQDLRAIDKNSWVIDPIVPKPYHLHRRIHLNAALSILITLDPFDPQSFHKLKILGNDCEVLKCQNVVNTNLHKWSFDKPIIENLLALLDMSNFPQDLNAERFKTKTNIGIVRDEECCICFCLELDDHEIPAEFCNNNRCRRVFHTSCLYQWLAAIVGNQVVFDRIHGTCPNCNQYISCCTVSN